MEIVLHAVMAAPKTKNFAEVKERFYLLCELGSNIAPAKCGLLKNGFRITDTLYPIGIPAYRVYRNGDLKRER